jgi:hypothetical protein
LTEPIFQFAEKFVTDFSLRRIVIFFSFIFLILLSFTLYEWQTASFELSRYERSVKLLTNLDILVNSTNQDIKISANKIILNLTKVIDKDDITSKFEIIASPELTQSFFATLPWILILLIILPDSIKKKEEDISHIIIGFIIILLFIGLIAYFIPTDWDKWLRFGGMQGINLIFMSILAYYGNKD